MSSTKVGFIGQGFIGKHMADDFEARGYSVVRYALEEPYINNREAIADCGIVFIAVPTPTTPLGFDGSILEQVLPVVGVGKTAVIKSTVLPGTTKKLQALFPGITIMHSPEFLREKHAASDTQKPERNILGVTELTDELRIAASGVMEVLPLAPYTLLCSSNESELIKYGGNCFLALKVVYMNLLYDLAEKTGARYEVIAEAIGHDPRIGSSHTAVIDRSGHEGAISGRGAGGHCFPKDLAALRAEYEQLLSGDMEGIALLRAFEDKNNQLLINTKKDLDLLKGIYGPDLRRGKW